MLTQGAPGPCPSGPGEPRTTPCCGEPGCGESGRSLGIGIATAFKIPHGMIKEIICSECRSGRRVELVIPGGDDYVSVELVKDFLETC